MRQNTNTVYDENYSRTQISGVNYEVSQLLKRNLVRENVSSFTKGRAHKFEKCTINWFMWWKPRLLQRNNYLVVWCDIRSCVKPINSIILTNGCCNSKKLQIISTTPQDVVHHVVNLTSQWAPHSRTLWNWSFHESQEPNSLLTSLALCIT